MKRSPWFNARAEPPVNGGADAMYEARCESRSGYRPVRTWKASVIFLGKRCDRCQWRGLLREDGGKA